MSPLGASLIAVALAAAVGAGAGEPVLLADVTPGEFGSVPRILGVADGVLYFAAWGDEVGWGEIVRSVWSSDGTQLGTRSRRHVGRSIVARAGAALGDSLYFPMRDDGWGLARAGAGGVDTVEADNGWRAPVAVGDVLLLPAVDGLYATDGSVDGAELLVALARAPQSVVAAGGLGFFSGAAPPDEGNELWRSDGTAAGTFLVDDLRPGPGPELLGDLLLAAGGVVLFADDGTNGAEPWFSDGTPGGTELLLDVCPGTCSSRFLPFGAAGGLGYMLRTDATEPELWRTDGTSAGTFAIATVVTPAPLGAVDLGGRLAYVDGFRGTGLSLHVSDGSAAGTARFAELCDGDCSGVGPSLLAMDDDLFFLSRLAGAGWGISRSDGTAAGTERLRDLTPGGGVTGSESQLVRVGERIIYVADDGFSGEELWVYDPRPSISASLLRNDSVSTIDPIEPGLDSLLPLDSTSDAYAEPSPGDTDPDRYVLHDATRPLVLYQLDGPGELRLTGGAGKRVRLWF